MLSIQLGNCIADNRKVDKTSDITLSVTKPCSVYNECSIMNPVFKLSYEASIVSYNYCKIEAWGRYYFIVDHTVAPGGVIYITCKEDVLMSNKDEILNLNAYLVRTENSSLQNKFLNDNRHPRQENRKCRTYDFNRSPFTANYAQDVIYILTVIGGHHS